MLDMLEYPRMSEIRGLADERQIFSTVNSRFAPHVAIAVESHDMGIVPGTRPGLIQEDARPD